MRLAGPPPTTALSQVAYVWAIDTTLDGQVDYYVFVDLAPGAPYYRATLEQATAGGLLTRNDRLPFELVGRSTIRVFVPLLPHIASGGANPTVQWYAYMYLDRLPPQDEIDDNGVPFVLKPRP
ncbi:MAG: hypothetical protein WKH64_14375 [Chloroflexia bacterium]